MVQAEVPSGGRIRQSGMPPDEVWSSFFNVEEILNRMQIDSHVVDAADFACGYGTFTIPAAKRIAGIMYAVDIDPKMTYTVEDRARKSSLDNVRPVVRDLLRGGSGLEDGSVDYVMLFNILHSEQPQTLLREAFRVLRRGGRVGIIHWIRDPRTPRGPPLDMRPTVEQCTAWCLESDFAKGSEISTDLKPYHFGLIMRK
jgi:ubiquinone/menaquinone biosynthesis C-methylase UbiE